jgi:hypothetical protein
MKFIKGTVVVAANVVTLFGLFFGTDTFRLYVLLMLMYLLLELHEK